MELSYGVPKSGIIHAAFFYAAFAFFVNGNGLWAQDLEQRILYKLSVEQGLSQSTPYSIIQDKNGFMWIGTADGLNRYDGYTFKVYRHIPSDSASLSDNFVQTLYEDRAGVLWIGTRDGGLNRFNPASGTFTVYRYQVQNPKSLSNSYVSAVCEDHKGNFWVGTEGGGLNLFNPQTGSFTRFGTHGAGNRTLGSNLIFSLCPHPDGRLWVGTGDAGLQLFDPQTGLYERILISTDTRKTIQGLTIRALYADKSGTLWVGTEYNGLYKLKSDTFTPEVVQLPAFVSLPESRISITTIREDRAGTLWIGTPNGLFAHNRVSGTTIPIFGQQVSRSRESVNADIIMSCYEDKTGLLWVGVYGGGVLYFQPEAMAFMSVTQLPGSAYPLGAVFALLEDRLGWIWVGTRNGLHLYNPNSGSVITFLHDDRNPRSLSNNHIYCIYESRDGTIWIGTAGGLNRYDPGSGGFIRYQYDGQNSEGLRHNAVFTILEDQRGILWIGTLGGGLYAFDRSLEQGNAQWRVFRADANNPQSLSNNVIRALAEDKQGNIWVGTRGGGVNCLNPTTLHVIRYQHDERLPGTLSHNAVYSLFFDRRGRLWVGTQGGGVNIWLPEQASWMALRENQGLANDVVYGMLQDRQGGIWLSSNKGLSVLNLDSLQNRGMDKPLVIRNYDVRDGLQSNEFNAGAYYQGRSGRLYFGGIRGYTVFTPDSIRQNPHIPPVVVTSFKVFNKEIFLAQGGQTLDTVRLEYGDTFFSIEFSALNYVLSEKNMYRYQLENVDADWIDARQKREAQYTNILPGEYRFRVVGSNNDGLWNEKGATLLIIIKPPFWKTWWFRWSGGLVFVAIVVSVITWRVRTISQREALQREIAQLELQSLRLHMNPHFIFNSINSIQYLIAEGDNKAAMQYLSTFAQLMRRILQQTDLLYISIADEIELLDMYIKLEQLRYDDTFQYKLDCPELMEIRHILIPAMVVQPYVENALRHGLGKRTMGGFVSVTFSTHPEHSDALRCIVEDNGIGRAQAKMLQHKSGTTEHLSLATSLTQRRLDVLHRTRFSPQQMPISVHYTDLLHPSGEAAGTRVEILLPIVHIQQSPGISS